MNTPILAPRKIFTIIEETKLEGERPVDPTHRVVIVGAVFRNPWADQGYVEDLIPGINSIASDLGALLATRVIDALGDPLEAYGKAAIVGLNGEVEHGSGLIHNLRFGDQFRNVANATTLLPAVEKRGPAGINFDIPLKHFTDMKIRSHHQTVEARVADAPHPDEILIALAGANQGRPQQRLAELGQD